MLRQSIVRQRKTPKIEFLAIYYWPLDVACIPRETRLEILFFPCRQLSIGGGQGWGLMSTSPPALGPHLAEICAGPQSL